MNKSQQLKGTVRQYVSMSYNRRSATSKNQISKPKPNLTQGKRLHVKWYSRERIEQG